MVRRFVLGVGFAASAGTTLAQPQGPAQRRPDWGGGRMSGEERQRFREDLQRQQHGDPRRYGDPAGEERARRYAEWQRLSPEQREGIRRDMRDYNRDFDRRR
jgi:Ni/Co efflux regulator RcnB